MLLPWCNSSIGFNSLPWTGTLCTPKRRFNQHTITFFGDWPLTVNPPLSALAPVCTPPLAEMLAVYPVTGGSNVTEEVSSAPAIGIAGSVSHILPPATKPRVIIGPRNDPSYRIEA